MTITPSTKHFFSQHGYCYLPGFFNSADVTDIDSDYHQLLNTANALLSNLAEGSQSYGEFYRHSTHELIVVPEDEQPTQACRFEYLTPTSAQLKHTIVPRLAAEITALIEQPVSLFKDKCNIKAPGGGAFTAHQDIPAYIQLGTDVHVTAAVFLDHATAENGALEFAQDYHTATHAEIAIRQTGLGEQPYMPFYQGGKNNGRIYSEIEQQLDWQRLETNPGDVVLFNSYVPHRSEVNQSTKSRRAYFFTFNLSAQGEYYARYYSEKRAAFDDPRFHIATPTQYERNA